MADKVWRPALSKAANKLGAVASQIGRLGMGSSPTDISEEHELSLVQAFKEQPTSFKMIRQIRKRLQSNELNSFFHIVTAVFAGEWQPYNRFDQDDEDRLRDHDILRRALGLKSHKIAEIEGGLRVTTDEIERPIESLAQSFSDVSWREVISEIPHEKIEAARRELSMLISFLFYLRSAPVQATGLSDASRRILASFSVIPACDQASLLAIWIAIGDLSELRIMIREFLSRHKIPYEREQREFPMLQTGLRDVR